MKQNKVKRKERIGGENKKISSKHINRKDSDKNKNEDTCSVYIFNKIFKGKKLN